MRGTGDHIPPAQTLPTPDDNTSEYVYGYVRAANAYGANGASNFVHPEIAREIAAWFQTPSGDGLDFASFASTGTITDDLGDAINRELNSPHYDRDTRDALEALNAYVRASSVRPYTIGHNTVGYIPESPIQYALTLSDAVDYYRSELEYYRDNLAECECDIITNLGADDSPDMCEYCEEEAYVNAFLADETNTLPIDYEGPGLSFLTDLPSEVLPTHYWLATPVEAITYAEYLTMRDQM